jgi:glycosyltransferase involved in cell wall biosynthesis
MPVRNGDQFLAEALDALLAQTFGDFELVISDNASTDGTEARCRALAARDPRVGRMVLADAGRLMAARVRAAGTALPGWTG